MSHTIIIIDAADIWLWSYNTHVIQILSIFYSLAFIHPTFIPLALQHTHNI